MKETVKWGLITVAIYVGINYLIPVNIYSAMLYLIVIAGAAAITYTSIKFLASIFLKDVMSAVKNTELPDEERKAAIAKAYNPSGCVIVPVIVIIFFLMSGLMIWREVQMENYEIENYGQLTQARVINGSSFASRRLDLTNLVLGFKTEKGDSVFLKHSISASQFQNFYKDETIPIIYSTRHPSILKIVNTREELEKYIEKQAGKKSL